MVSRTLELLTQEISVVNRGHIFGLTLSNNTTDPANDIDIAAGEAASDASSPALITLASAITKRLDVAWAVGTSNGGLDTGSKTNSTWYHVWLIRRSDTGVVDALFSTSATAPTMPTNYDQKRRIGSVGTDDSGNILAFVQEGDEFLFNTAQADVNVTNAGTSAVLRTLTVPTGLKVTAIINARVNWASTGTGRHLISSPDQSDETPSDSNGAFETASSGGNWADTHRLRIRTNTSAQIRTRSTTSSTNDRWTIATVGWIDRRGRGF